MLGSVPNDFASTAGFSKNLTANQITSNYIQTGRIDTDSLYVQGQPITLNDIVPRSSLLFTRNNYDDNDDSGGSSTFNENTNMLNRDTMFFNPSDTIVSKQFLSEQGFLKTFSNSSSSSSLTTIPNSIPIFSKTPHELVPSLIKIQEDEKLIVQRLQLVQGAEDGFILTSDSRGNAFWMPPSTGEVQGPLKTRHNTLAIWDSTDGRLLKDCEYLKLDDETQTLYVHNGAINTSNVQAVDISASSIDCNIGYMQDLHVGIIVSKTLQTNSLSTPSLYAQNIECLDANVQILNCTDITIPSSIPPGHILVSSDTCNPSNLNQRQTHWTSLEDLKQSWSLSEIPPLQEQQSLSSSQQGQKHIMTETLTAEQEITTPLLSSDKIVSSGTAVLNSILTNQLQINSFGKPVQDTVLTAIDNDGRAVWKPIPIPKLVQISSPSSSLLSPRSLSDETKNSFLPVIHPIRDNIVQFEQSNIAVTQDNSLKCKNVYLSAEGSLYSNDNPVLNLYNDGTFGNLFQTALNISIGNEAMKYSSECFGNVAIGPGSLKNLKSGKYNVATGCDALKCFNGNETVAIGGKTLSKLISGRNNNGIGYQSMCELETGDNNLAFGNAALKNLVNGNNHICIGTNSNEHLMNGHNGITIGHFSSVMDNQLSNYICLGNYSRAHYNGDFSLGSEEAPLKISQSATSGTLSGINPDSYLQCHINGIPYKLALYRP